LKEKEKKIIEEYENYKGEEKENNMNILMKIIIK